MKLLFKILLVLIVACSLACRKAPLFTVRDAPISPHAQSISRVEEAIKRAGVSLGWQVRKIGPGVMEGVLFLRSHKAVVRIPHTRSSYSIEYVSSENLHYDGSRIHKNYNFWIQNLDRAIQRELL
jgi:hypothetical protein